MTLEQLRNQLSDIEPDENTYAGIGVSEIPLLDQLLQDEETWMASRAVFALSRQSDQQAIKILSRVAEDPRPELRVSLAASIQNLPPTKASSNILLNLLDDTELGVRRYAIEAVSSAHNKAVREKLREIETQDPAPAIREIAKTRIQQLHIR
jgi:vacuolar-type H+-ATPase subunit F/Vma7